MKKKFMMLFLCMMVALSACGKASNEADVGENFYEEECASSDVGEQVLVTEKQYNNVYLVTGEPDYQEKVVGINSYIML